MTHIHTQTHMDSLNLKINFFLHFLKKFWCMIFCCFFALDFFFLFTDAENYIRLYRPYLVDSDSYPSTRSATTLYSKKNMASKKNRFFYPNIYFSNENDFRFIFLYATRIILCSVIRIHNFYLYFSFVYPRPTSDQLTYFFFL